MALFFYRFAVGDDPIVAAVMPLALIATSVLVGNYVNAWWLVSPVAVAMGCMSLWRRMATVP